ncbi:RimJ/RimL family protein N-acetyltransferase [Microbacterium resistens]|uniref:RimJ/RimL family protein N-acetyltransferase n=1 Tax=Microbacterium resistens TaxID=156977 RepID=A0ABU1SG09_9MICO|nr:GNAT family N-acetyltransferase [Microbacterium resistens]MDR6867893.1 RimJ/RimL family protein N-acetyltransferase [Microbacterium resistens]
MTDPLDAVDWPLRTERLIIRRLSPADTESMWRYRRLPEVSEWISTAPETLEAFRDHLSEPWRAALILVIELPATANESAGDSAGGPAGGPEGPTVIGDVMLRVEDGWAQTEVIEGARGSQAELGWALDPAYGGRGYATEAVRAVVDLCVGRLGLRRVHAGCFADNEPSWRLMERIGMRREEHSRGTALHRSGRWMDGMNYGLLAEEWAPSAER